MKKNLVRLICLLLAAVALSSPAQAATKPVLYNAIITYEYANSITGIYAEPDSENSKMIGTYQPGTPIEVVEVLPDYVGINYKNGVGYVLRHRIANPVALDPVNTPRFGTAVNMYFSTLDRETLVKAAPDASSDTLITMQAGTMLGFLDVTDGWARLIFKRQYGYVDTRTLGELAMVAAAPDEGNQFTPIAVYNSFYNLAETEANLNRIINLKVCGERMDRVMMPGDVLDFNGTVGPFRASFGYLPAPGLVEGGFIQTYGGGSCQVSSTLYYVVLQLTGLTVLQRSPHGKNGISYLPHGVDASSGALNFRFRNDYSFPIRIRTHVQDGSLFIAIFREV
ncbi:MAG: VanW family protein [Clostridiales bacterium]|nr:VanW family protein [Clostridiales bacterium]